ncbi:MAG: hypothetical protein J5589_03750 [Firmicutes bacterium]|nr:hypothetical protein [Bacillota bacterium]
MKEKYPLIAAETAHMLLDQVKGMTPAHRGIDRQAYLFDDYAVLSTRRLKLRNVDVRDDDLHYLDELIETLADLRNSGIHVVPILGYCYEQESPDGEGFLFMRRAKGEELYDDALICRYETWTQNQDDEYLTSDADAAEYIVRRTHEVAGIPQRHFDKFISDILTILGNDILIDFQGKSNFFYDREEGFQFIDLDSHTDNYYGLTDNVVSAEAWAAVGGFVPCHFGAGTKAFAHLALDPNAIREIGETGIKQLADDNLRIFDKCVRAMKANHIKDTVLQNTLKSIKVFGQ